MTRDLSTLRARLLDDFSRDLLDGALRVAADVENPIRLNQFAPALRELFSYTLQTLSPDDRVTRCAWYVQDRDAKGPTRKQRAKYATQGGLSDDFIAESGIDVAHLHDDAVAAINELSKYTHVRPETVVRDREEADRFIDAGLKGLQGLFESFDICRAQVIDAIFKHVTDEVVDALISETILSIDEIASHHSIEEISVEETTVTALTEEKIHFEVMGSVSVELQWGSNGDLRRGDGALLDESFPFKVTMWSPVDDVTQFNDTVYAVDTSSWFEGYYDEDEPPSSRTK